MAIRSHKLERVFLYTDGASRSNPGHAAIAYRILDEKGHLLKECGQCIGILSNNVAEYTAIITGLKEAANYTDGEVLSHSDSMLAVSQLTGVWKVRHAEIKKLYEEVKKLEKSFKSVKYFHLPREHQQIQACDRLCNDALDNR